MKIKIDFKLRKIDEKIDVKENNVSNNIKIPVETIKAIITGSKLCKNTLTNRVFIIFVNKKAKSKMLKKAGKQIAKVARNAPNTPPSLYPTKEAILTPSEPGVASDIPTISKNSSADSQLWFITSSLIKDIIPYPPPKEKAPIFKKTKNKTKYFIFYDATF